MSFLDWLFARGSFYVLLVFAMIVLTLGIFRGETTFHSYFSLSESKKTLSSTVTNLESDILALEQEIEKIHSSPEYIRKLLRDKYHLTEEGEHIIFFEDN